MGIIIIIGYIIGIFLMPIFLGFLEYFDIDIMCSLDDETDEIMLAYLSVTWPISLFIILFFVSCGLLGKILVKIKDII